MCGLVIFSASLFWKACSLSVWILSRTYSCSFSGRWFFRSVSFFSLLLELSVDSTPLRCERGGSTELDLLSKLDQCCACISSILLRADYRLSWDALLPGSIFKFLSCFCTNSESTSYLILSAKVCFKIVLWMRSPIPVYSLLWLLVKPKVWSWVWNTFLGTLYPCFTFPAVVSSLHETIGPPSRFLVDLRSVLRRIRSSNYSLSK